MGIMQESSMKIESDRTLIRNFILNDLDDLQEILGDEEVMKNCEPPYGKGKTAVFLRDFCIGRKGALACIHIEERKYGVKNCPSCDFKGNCKSI